MHELHMLYTYVYNMNYMLCDGNIKILSFYILSFEDIHSLKKLE